MASVYKYQVRCTTDNKWVTVWSESPPTVCPENNSHTINSSLTSVVGSVSENTMKVKEENIETGGNFSTTPLTIHANANSITYGRFSWPFNVSALSVNFNTNSTHTGDCIDMYGGKNTIIGAITNFISPASSWTSQDYLVGNIVVYPNPVFGDRVYTCIANTVSNASPASSTGLTNKLYWKHGYEVPVSSTVTENTMIGYYLNVTNFSTVTDLGRVISLDKTTNKVYVEKNPDNTYSPFSPSYIRQTAYFMKDYLISGPWRYVIGESTVGGSSIPEDIIIEVAYTNKSLTDAKDFTGYVEFFY